MITTDRNQFIGAHLSKTEKEALRKLSNESKPRRSMSQIIHDAVRRVLVEAGKLQQESR